MRSRSRSRGESYGGQALGNAEEAPQDLETIGRNNSSAEGHSLLQRKMQRIARNRNLSEETFSRLSPPGNPSNEVSGSPSMSQPGWIPVDESSSSTHKQNIEDFIISDEEVEQVRCSKGTFEQSLLLKPDRMDFVKLMQRWDNNPLKLQLPEDLEARPIALQFLAHSLAGWNDDVQHLHIYTDGSFSPDMQVASFSFAVFGWNPSAEEDKSTFSGWLADVVLTDQLDPNYTGASHHSSVEAETAGLIWSHIWLIQSGCQLPTTFHYDSKTSGHGAAGLFQIGSNNHQLKKLRQLVHLLQTVRSGTTDRHQPADLLDCQRP